MKRSTCIVLFSGGLDSTVMLAMAIQSHPTCIALSFKYGQRNAVELESAANIARFYKIEHRILPIDVQALSGSSLLSREIEVPKERSFQEMQSQGIPSTYVPARNTLFLAYAIAQAEICDASAIYCGSNASDYHCYPDCREEYFQAIQAVMNTATKQAVEGHPPQIKTPLVLWNKSRIIREGQTLNIPFHLTLSCYDPPAPQTHCGFCDACQLRKQGFREAHLEDPSSYRS